MSELKLYAHEPASLLPLLQRWLPHTQTIVGTILSNPTQVATESSESKRSVLEARPLERIYASFPPRSLPDDDNRDWLVTLALPEPNEQMRVWHRAEVEANVGMANQAQANGHGLSDEEFERAMANVTDAVNQMKELYPRQYVVGQLNIIWEEGLRGALSAPSRTICRVFLAPKTELQSSEDVDLDKLGLKLDHTRVGDEKEMSVLTKYHPPPYILSRSTYTTLLRPKAGGKPVCWVMTHADGALGALYTLPEWRRKGLAKLVVRERLRAMAKEGDGVLRANLQVEDGNMASEAMWRSLGWEPAWQVGWVYSTEDQEKFKDSYD